MNSDSVTMKNAVRQRKERSTREAQSDGSFSMNQLLHSLPQPVGTTEVFNCFLCDLKFTDELNAIKHLKHEHARSSEQSEMLNKLQCLWENIYNV